MPTVWRQVHANLYHSKRPDMPWQVVFTNREQREPAGRFKRVVKWFAHQRAAQDYLRDLNARLALEGSSGLVFDAVLRTDALAARQRLNEAGLKVTTLAEAAAALIAARGGPRREAVAARPALAAFLEEKEGVEGCAWATVVTLRNRLTKWLDESGVADVDEINRAQVEALRLRPGVSAQSRRNDMAALSTWCSWLLDKGFIAHHPLRGLRRPKLPTPNKATFSAAECGRLLSAAREYLGGKWLGTIATMVWTGCRPSELAQTRLLYGRLAVARIEGGKLKGRANRSVPLSAAAMAWLKAAGRPAMVAPINTKARRRICEKAGLKWVADITRHTYISNRLALVQNDGEVAREAGTSEAMIHRHYASVKLGPEARAWAALRPKE